MEPSKAHPDAPDQKGEKPDQPSVVPSALDQIRKDLTHVLQDQGMDMNSKISSKEAQYLEMEVWNRLVERYKIRDHVNEATRASDIHHNETRYHIEGNIREILKYAIKYGGWDFKVLDLGCGSNETHDSQDEFIPNRNQRRFEPWFCRALQECGGHPVGVDVNDNSQEAFEHHRLDLSDPHSLDIFPDHSFDEIRADSIKGSPTQKVLALKQAGEKDVSWMDRRRFDSNWKAQEIYRTNAKAIANTIATQMRRLLKPERLEDYKEELQGWNRYY